MSDIIYPTLDLFLYDLRDVLNATEEENFQRHENFLSKLPDQIELVDPDLESEYLELLPNQKTVDFTNPNKNLSGYYYPVRLNDTYGLQIDCSIDNKTDPQTIDSFTVLKEEIESKLKGTTATIGQTWMLSGYISAENSSKTPEEIAKSCYNLFVKDANFEQDLQGKGRLFEGEIFEFLQYQPSQKINLHIIIIIYPNRTIMEQSGKLYKDWMGLFCYKHKILFAYTQSRFIKKILVKYYQKVESRKKSINQNNKQNIDDQLEEIQNILETYTIDIPKLNFQKQILDINLINYDTRLEIIKNKLEKSDNLEFFNKFSKLSHQKYIVQITKDYENMELGLRILESNINIIRSQIEAEKSNRDRIFQNLVTVIGTGTAVTSLIDYEGKKCNAVLTIIDSSTNLCNNNFTKTILFPIAMILIFGILGLIIKKILTK